MKPFPFFAHHMGLLVSLMAMGFVVLIMPLKSAFANGRADAEASAYALVVSDKLNRGDADSVAIVIFADSLEHLVAGQLVEKPETRAFIFELLTYAYAINISDSVFADSMTFISIVRMLKVDPAHRLTNSRMLNEFPRLRTIYLEARLVPNPRRSFWTRKSFKFGAAALSLLIGTAALSDLGPFADDPAVAAPLPGPPPPPAP